MQRSLPIQRDFPMGSSARSLGPACRRPIPTWPEHYSLRQRDPDDWTELLSLPLTDLADGDQARAANFVAEVEGLLGVSQSGRRHRSGRETLLSLPKASPDGFDIDLLVTPDRISACFGGLDQDFCDLASAMCWVRRGLCHDYLLAITRCGEHPVAWQLSRADAPGEAQTTLAAGLGVWTWRWRARTTVERRNDILATRREPGVVPIRPTVRLAAASGLRR